MHRLALLAVAFVLALAAPASADKFERLFPNLPAFAPPDQALLDLGQGPAPGAPLPAVFDPAFPMFDPNLAEDDDPAGRSFDTYFGQQLDHDVTRDATALADASPVLPENLRTPLIDLDTVYGVGDRAQPELYDPADPRKLRTNPDNPRDLPRRADGSAIIGDPRNDENMVVAQVHLFLIRLHNRLVDTVDLARPELTGAEVFTEARKLTRWYDQAVIVEEFLPHIVDPAVLADVFQGYGKRPKTKHFKERGTGAMIVEFSSAAYRLHDLVRRAYNIVEGGGRVQVFNGTPGDLAGNRPIDAARTIFWPNFVDFPGDALPGPVNVNRKMDGKLSSGLFFLPPIPGIIEQQFSSLAQRNLLRGKRIGLPSYQAVARRLGETPLTNEQFGLTDPRFGGEAPLWFGIFREASVLQAGAHLGPTGSRIVAEVLLGNMWADKTSVLHEKAFRARPAFQLLRDAGVAP